MYQNTFEVIDVEAVSVPQVLITVNRGLHDASIAINFEYPKAHNPRLSSTVEKKKQCAV